MLIELLSNSRSRAFYRAKPALGKASLQYSFLLSAFLMRQFDNRAMSELGATAVDGVEYSLPSPGIAYTGAVDKMECSTSTGLLTGEEGKQQRTGGGHFETTQNILTLVLVSDRSLTYLCIHIFSRLSSRSPSSHTHMHLSLSLSRSISILYFPHNIHMHMLIVWHRTHI